MTTFDRVAAIGLGHLKETGGFDVSKTVSEII